MELLGRAGADLVVVRRFDLEFSAWTPEKFARNLLARQLHAKLVLVGEDFRFGAHRAGDRPLLEELGRELGFEVQVCGVAADAGGAFSSTRARGAILAGDLAEAQRVLGRWHAISGVVAHGAKLGRTLGFPTANLADVPEMLPPDGIYAVLVDEVLRSKETGGAVALAPGALSIGMRPTIDGAEGRTVEVFLLDFDRDLYGATLRLHLVERLREERRYRVARGAEGADRARRGGGAAGDGGCGEREERIGRVRVASRDHSTPPAPRPAGRAEGA